MTMMGMRASAASLGASDKAESRDGAIVDTCDLPHPPYRVPFIGDVVGLNPRTPFQSSLPQTKKLGPISARKMLGTEMVAVSGLELVAEVHDESRFGKYVGHHLEPLRSVIGDALITVETENPNWKLAHDILKPAFSREAMQGYHGIMLQAIREMLRHWDGAAEGGHRVDVTADTTRLALESIGRAGFGYPFGSFDRRRPHAFISAMNRMLKYASWSTFPLLTRLLKPAIRRNGEVMGGIVDDVIAARCDGMSPETPDLLDLMLNSTHPVTGRQLDPVNIRQQVITFIVAGHETTSGALSFALYYLTQNPDVLAKAKAEVDALWGDSDNPDPAYGDVAKLRYVRGVLDEALRLWPTAPGYLRVARKDTVLGGRYRIKAGQWVLVVLPLVQRDPSVWPNPEEFDPDRFAPGRMRGRAHAYKPFGTGQRACIGRQFAIHEAVLTLALILHRYDLAADNGYKLKIAESITLKPSGFRLGLRRRAASSRVRPADAQFGRLSA
ncbi:cytochrome P450 [Candidatus Mycobacterium wuenschmannii]|uniref:Cytochrome P450 n=1 Tax=Candidatus Mycobacterium wuenschmannii TaxID=3027808 RepID=A0ABY8VTR5_9MYCO|nr:cytochrome P450 [Candidatus Mycobacterium wuenschmannii]WIM86471.1 cytochrome P450 [Candidatus Mycobacterium wuenschmannii]